MYALVFILVMQSNGACREAGHEEARMSSTTRGQVEIRIKNASGRDFDRVRVVFPDRDEVDYGPVARGGFSAFRSARRAYRYAQIHVKAGDRDFSLQPMDYVGERDLSPGRYTYVVRIVGDGLAVDLEIAT